MMIALTGSEAGERPMANKASQRALEAMAMRKIVSTLFRVRRLLDEEQRAAIGDSIRTLIANRNDYLAEFQNLAFWEEAPSYLGSRYKIAGADADSVTVCLEETMMFFALSRLTELAECFDKGHLDRTAELSRLLAIKLGADTAFVHNLFFAARLHDIGLIGVPSALLRRRGTLDIYEQEVVDSHTRIGAFIVNTFIRQLGVETGPLTVAKEISFHHHDRFDGQGVHPFGGKNIPYSARIFAVVDTYDNLRRERPHRPANDHASSLVLMKACNEGAFRQFDPDILKTFLCAEQSVSALYRAMGI